MIAQCEMRAFAPELNECRSGANRLPGSPLEYALIGAIVAIPRLLALRAIPLFDDAFITFRYARNLAEGKGLVYNPGAHVLGTTTPLFAVLLAALMRIGIQPPVAARAVAIACDIFTGVLCYRVLKSDLGRSAALIAVTLFALSPNAVRISAGGMEASLFLACSVLAVYLISTDRPGAALILASLAFYVRPESVLLAGFAALSLLRNPRGRALLEAAGSALILGIPLLVIWSHYGSPLPSSVIAKGRYVGGGVWQVLRIFFFPPDYIQGIMSVAALVGLPLLWKRSRFGAWLTGWTAAYVLAYVSARPLVFTWYALPVYFTVAIGAGAAAARFTETFGIGFRRWWPEFAAALALSIAMWGAVWIVVGVAPVTKNVYSPLRAWCTRNIQPGDTVAAGDVGAVGYFSDAYIYDLDGLVWPQRFDYRGARAAILARRPKFILAIVSRYNRELFDPSSKLGLLYRPVARFSKFGSTNIHIKSGELPDGWRQDYVMFARIRPVASTGLVAHGPSRQ